MGWDFKLIGYQVMIGIKGLEVMVKSLNWNCKAYVSTLRVIILFYCY